MTDLSIFLQLAQIAAAYIGFASLIAAVSNNDVKYYIQFQAFITISLIVIVSSLIPIVIESFSITTTALWQISAATSLFLNTSGVGVCSYIARRSRISLTSSVGSEGSRIFFWGIDIFLVQAPLGLIALGIIRNDAAALYLIVMIVHIIQATQLFIQMTTAIRTH